MARRTKKEMAKLRERALSLSEANPTLSIARIAKHFGVAQKTVSKWFDEENRKRWST